MCRVTAFGTKSGENPVKTFCERDLIIFLKRTMVNQEKLTLVGLAPFIAPKNDQGASKLFYGIKSQMRPP
jgi:hypothetical protein